MSNLSSPGRLDRCAARVSQTPIENYFKYRFKERCDVASQHDTSAKVAEITGLLFCQTHGSPGSDSFADTQDGGVTQETKDHGRKTDKKKSAASASWGC